MLSVSYNNNYQDIILFENICV